MLPALSNKTDFYKHYWNYYLSIERSFLATEPYIAINQKNFNAFSVEFIKLYQIICSEVDVTAKCAPLSARHLPAMLVLTNGSL